jgi:hypothetical protein
VVSAPRIAQNCSFFVIGSLQSFETLIQNGSEITARIHDKENVNMVFDVRS